MSNIYFILEHSFGVFTVTLLKKKKFRWSLIEILGVFLILIGQKFPKMKIKIKYSNIGTACTLKPMGEVFI